MINNSKYFYVKYTGYIIEKQWKFCINCKGQTSEKFHKNLEIFLLGYLVESFKIIVQGQHRTV